MWPFKKKTKYFKIGDTIKCIDDRGWNVSLHSINLIFGNTYKILLVVKCPVCSCVCYDIGSRFHNPTYYTDCRLGIKGHELPGMGIHLAGHFRFEKTIEAEQTAKQIQERINECIKNEEFEKIKGLQKELEKAI